MKVLSSIDYLSLYRSSKHSDVINHFKSQITSPAAEPEISKIVAASFFALGDLSSCYEILFSIESCFSSDIEYLSMFGACCRRLGKLHDAKSLLEKALNCDPTSLPAKNNYANLLIDLNSFEEAEAILLAILKDNPDFADAKDNLARLSYKRESSNTNNVAEINPHASFSLADPLSLAFSHEEVKCSRSLISNHKDQKSVPQKAKELSSLLPNTSDQSISSDQIDLAFKACAEGRYEFALNLCNEVKVHLGDSPSLYECLGDIYIGVKNFLKAEIFLLHALGLGASGLKIYLNLCSLSCIRGDLQLAKFYYDKAFSIDPSSKNLQAIESQINQVSKSGGSDYSLK